MNPPNDQMKHAILIMAHQNPGFIKKIIGLFGHGFNFYVHFDKRNSDPGVEDLKKEKSVKLVSKKYTVNWGGIGIVLCQLHLIEEALKDKENSYFHLISGQDILVKPTELLYQFFKDKHLECFMNYSILNESKKQLNGIPRFVYFFPFDSWKIKSTLLRKIICKAYIVQKFLGIRRKRIPGIIEYSGSAWWSLSRPVAQYLINYSKENKHILDRFRYCFAADEVYVQTILLNSEFKDYIVNDNLRYIDWLGGNGASPKVLDETDIENINKSSAFFARKIVFPKSEKLVKHMFENVLSPK
jgi:hypothetical protein